MLTTTAMPTAKQNDEQLVARSLDGNRDAFREIVERYQTLISSLAYCATGNLSQSEDLAQETFVTAWRKLPELREPAKLRSWLCGIVRFLISREYRRQSREPVHNAAELDTAHETPALEASPSDQAISREEEAIMWRALSQMPADYREPLVLFYRERQSVARVAAELELTEDAVKQRLLRGRKMLQEQVHSLVEQALGRTGPGSAFSGAVLAALPASVGATAGAGASLGAKSAGAAKSGMLAVCLAALVPFVGVIGVAVAHLFVIQSHEDSARRRLKAAGISLSLILLFLAAAWGGEIAVRALCNHFACSDAVSFAARLSYWWTYCAIVCALVFWFQPFTAMSRESSQEASVASARKRSMAVFTCAMLLAIFWWPLRVAWAFHDYTSVATMLGAVAVIAGRACWKVARADYAAVGTAMSWSFGLAFVLALTIYNLRLDVWLAAARHETIAEIHRLFPLWLVPCSSFAFLAWIWFINAMAGRRWKRESN